MAKLLNLGTLVPAVKQVQIGGKQYPIVEMSVGLFAEIKRFEGSEIESMSIADQVAAYAVLVQKLIPSLPQNVLDDLSVINLQQIFTFALNVADETNEAAAGDEVK
ncbi:hypothetical protein MKR02_21805 [Klebsiella sp. K4-41]|uniref:hypothetical protein n=1 Tax=Klebsiella sp. K4-41 TaxID=2920177 RepID=UPI0024DE405D|nr:hypothetical protein [Klebsiella sp. K4-41]MDK1925310.1 hypothetical protein [Klebsiella sp. K4-41]